MSKSLPGLLLFLFIAFSSRAEQPIFNISSAEANPGEVIEIDFYVDNFTNLILAQFSINWNPAVLEFVEVRNINPDVNGLSVSGSFNLIDFIDEGKIPFVWFEPTTNPESIPDNALFFTLAFEVIGAPCQSTLVEITGDPTEIEVAEDNKVEVGLVANSGTVSVPGVGCSQDITFTGNSVVGNCGTEVCIQFTVNNFSEVATMDFAMLYDPTVIQFDRFQNYAGLSGFGGGNTNSPSPGILRVVWSSLNAENEALPDGTTIFEICFDIIGSGGQSSSITFGHPLEIADVNNVIHTVNIIPASITSECAITGHALIAENVCTEPNGITCIDISVNDFEDIIVMQFSINWDPNLFHFHHLEGFNLPELTQELFGLPPDIAEGQLSVGWFTVDAGVTVPDLTTIFTLCLEAVGPAGSSSPITFSDIPTEVEFATEDSLVNFGLVHGSADIRLNCDDTTGCELSYVLTPTSPNCPGASTGSLNLNLDIGDCQCTPTFLWNTSPPVTTEDLIGVPAGTYTVTITCDNIVIASGTILDPDGMEVTSNITHPLPPNPNSGAINITVTGGTPPYSFQWSTTPPVSTEDLLNIPTGTYTVTITDANGCTFVPDPFVVGGDLTAFVTNASCEGSCNGSIALSPSFGASPYTYVWNTVPIQTTSTISNLCAGSYCVTITESGGATRDSCFVINQPNINVTADVTHDVNENCTGAIDLSITGAVNPIAYLWSTGQTSQDIINLCVGQHCVTITYGAGCTFDTCFSVSGNLALDLEGDFQISCHDDCDGEIRSEVIGGSGTITYLWSNTATTPDLTNLCPGIYSLTITDAAGNTATATRTITAPPALTYTALTTDPSGGSTSDGFISIIPTGGVPPYTYQWVGPVTGNLPAMNNLPAGTYEITVFDQNGCAFTDNIELRIEGVPCYEANKIITPNNDGKNDFFIIQCILNDDNQLFIFNRFGGLVYETTNYTNNWTGVDEDNQPVADGGYMWVLEIQNPAGPRILKGTINVLRTAD